MEITTVLLALGVILVIYLWYRRDDPRLPPCPVMPLPIVGHLLYLGKNPRSTFQQWRKTCGNIFTVYMGPSRVVVVNGYTLLRDTFVKNAAITSDRPYAFFDEATGKPGQGIIWSSGPIWNESRGIVVSILRSLGMGKSNLADKIQEIGAELIEVLISLEGKPTVLTSLISISVANVICSLLMGRRFRHDDEHLLRVIESLCLNVAESGQASLVNNFHFLRYLPMDFTGAKRIRARAEYIMHDFAEKFIDEIECSESAEHEPDNLIAASIKERNKKLRAGKSTFLDNDNLSRLVFDLFGAGIETVTFTIDWAILYLLHHPDIQEKIYKDIEMEIGTERLPNMQDKAKLPYLNAFIQETQRLSSIVPLSVPHMNNKEITIGGYTIPKDTQIYPSLDSVMFDTEIWGEDAESFRPERFLDEKGALRNPNEFIPFSLGRRSCPGESIARMELFLFLGAMIQRFKFLPEDPAVLPNLDIVFGLTVSPLPYKVKILDRKATAE